MRVTEDHAAGHPGQRVTLDLESRILLAAWPARSATPPPALPILDAGGANALDADDAAELASAGDPDTSVDRAPTVLPYTRQDDYDREPTERRTSVAVLQNEHLRAEFLLDLGGRLWSLRDRATDTELLHQPDALQPGNLALRNAWFAGGVEWNLGFTGHWALTCEPVHAARLTAPDGTPVLRLWEYERMLGLTWRIDVWLPADSSVLLVRPVLDNPTSTTIPVYWWSNIAAPQTEASTVITPADHAWHFGYSGRLKYLPVDDRTTHPATAPHSADFFFDIGGDDRGTPWICSVDGDGRGLLQASTERLRGRKLFVWGAGEGGRRWQQWLGGDRDYLEIQAGLARTQLEHLPLAPGERWSWTEAYGPIRIDELDDRHRAIAAGRDIVRTATRPQLDHAEKVLGALADVAPDNIVHTASGWGALEVAAGHREATVATPYLEHTLGDQQQPWLDLVHTGTFNDLAAAPVLGTRWTERLRAAAAESDPAAVDYHLGLAAHATADDEAAGHHWVRAREAGESDGGAHPLVLRSLAWLENRRGDTAAGCARYAAAIESAPDHAQLAVEGLTALCAAGEYAEAELLLGVLDESVLTLGRIEYLRCRVALGRGDLDTVRALLVDRQLIVPDLREGEDSLDALWADYNAATGQHLPLPAHYDFRMHPEEQAKEANR